MIPPKADKVNHQTALGIFNAQMKHRDPGAYGVRRFPFSDALPFLLTANEKDLSLALEMTRRTG